MKKLLFALLACFLFAVGAMAASTMPRDSEGFKIQSPSWDATLSQSITSAVSQNIVISSRLFYEFMSSTDCKGRLMNDTTKSSWPQFVIKANTPFRGSNDAVSTKAKAAFLNISGCTTGDFRAQ